MEAEAPTAGRLVGREHHLPVRVYYEDTDFTGVVYHANYLRYFERGRSDFLRLLASGHTELFARPDPAAFAVIRMQIDFRRPARMDDALVVVTAWEHMHGARLHARQRLLRGGELLTEAQTHVACIDARGRPRRPPVELAAALRPYLPGGG